MNTHFQTEIYRHTANGQLNTFKQIPDAGKIMSLYLLSYENEDKVKYIFFFSLAMPLFCRRFRINVYCSLHLFCSPAEINGSMPVTDSVILNDRMMARMMLSSQDIVLEAVPSRSISMKFCRFYGTGSASSRKARAAGDSQGLARDYLSEPCGSFSTHIHYAVLCTST
jgi:hypothetical protein